MREDVSYALVRIRFLLLSLYHFDESRYRYEIRIEKNELIEQEISELALIDEEGNLFYTECFSPKMHHRDTEKVFEVDIDFC